MTAREEFHHSLAVDTDLCIGCAHCIRHCPTKALRIREGKASLRKDWCVDCGECLKVCPVSAIFVEQDDFGRIFDYKCRVVLFPATFLGQFAETYRSVEIAAALRTLGFTHVFPVELTVGVIRRQMAEDIAACENKPLISPFCPAVVRLIQTKFPDLVGNIANVRTPVETTAMLCRRRMLDEGYAASDIGIFYVTPCAAKAASVKDQSRTPKLFDGLLNIDSLYNKVYGILSAKKSTDASELPPLPVVARRDMHWSMTSGESSAFGGRCLAVDGIYHVKDFLERMETTGDLDEIDFLELRACHRGCVGGALTPVNRFLAEERLSNRTKSCPDESCGAMASEEEAEFLRSDLHTAKMRPMTKLLYDGGIEQVLSSMAEASEIQRSLPGLDCGACGSPTCLSLSHDIVRGDAKLTNCIFMHLVPGGDAGALDQLEKVWGRKIFKHKQ